ncbi:hypothetical protein AVEN_20002-1 [Araneus ventricosus]|uniref:Uncharacterized protein n=1 Tax=Araneus ventricosus TaxID=182803 RepID=A0A4Y2I5V5_ARAVE|nr:hypothetical protein AVEN_20002-1 [Araneus ventricosus]
MSILNRLKQKLYTNLQLRLEGHIPNFIYLSLCVTELLGSQIYDYIDRPTVNPLSDLDQNLRRTYVPDHKTVHQILSNRQFQLLSYSVHMNADRHTDRLPVDGLCPIFDRYLQIMSKDHITNFMPVAQSLRPHERFPATAA